MGIPQTPQTIISRLIEPDKVEVWNGAWKRFFDIYHAPIKVMVNNSFWKFGIYDVPSYVIDDTVSEVILTLNKIFSAKKYDSKRTKFRFFLKTICNRRAVDYVRKNSDFLKTDSISDEDKKLDDAIEDIYKESQSAKLKEEELSAFKKSLILDAYYVIRHKFDSRTCTAFEMLILEEYDIETAIRELGVSENTIRNAAHRIVKKLREIISTDENLKELYHD